MSDSRASGRSRRGCWVGLTVSAGLIVWLTVWFIGAVFDAREAARRSQCSGNFCGLTLALHNYHDIYGCFPPAYINGPDGTPWHSWRVLILPWLDYGHVYDEYRFDEPWNSPHNRRLKAMMPSIMQCLSSPEYEKTPFTNYVAVVGAGTMFPGADAVSLDEIANPKDVIGIVEAEGLKIHWMEPRDLELATMSFRINDASAPSISSSHDGGARVVMIGGYCGGRFLKSDTPEPQIRRWLLISPDVPEEQTDETE